MTTIVVLLVICTAGSVWNTDKHFANTEDNLVVTVPAQETPVEETEIPTKTNRKILMNVSAYTASDDECGNGDNITASGNPGTPFHTCASDDLPFGTMLLINGQIWIVEDRFGGGYSNRVDLMMDTKEQCFAFGRQYIEVEIIE